METQQFNELLQSVEDMDAIACNNKKPSRMFKFSVHEVGPVNNAGFSYACFRFLDLIVRGIKDHDK